MSNVRSKMSKAQYIAVVHSMAKDKRLLGRAREVYIALGAYREIGEIVIRDMLCDTLCISPAIVGRAIGQLKRLGYLDVLCDSYIDKASGLVKKKYTYYLGAGASDQLREDIEYTRLGWLIVFAGLGNV